MMYPPGMSLGMSGHGLGTSHRSVHGGRAPLEASIWSRGKNLVFSISYPTGNEQTIRDSDWTAKVHPHPPQPL